MVKYFAKSHVKVKGLFRLKVKGFIPAHGSEIPSDKEAGT